MPHPSSLERKIPKVGVGNLVRKSGEANRPLTPILLKSIAIHLPFLSRYFCKSMPSSWQRAFVYTRATSSYHDRAPVCIAILLQKYRGQGVAGTLPSKGVISIPISPYSLRLSAVKTHLLNLRAGCLKPLVYIFSHGTSAWLLTQKTQPYKKYNGDAKSSEHFAP